MSIPQRSSLPSSPRRWTRSPTPARGIVSRRTLTISIVAGKTISWFESRFGAETPVVRTMSNTPAAIGRGITALVANRHVSPEGRDAAQALLAGIGETVWLDDESLMDAVTALSGGGPAYVFLLIETLTRAGVASGLPEAIASRLALHTVAGAGRTGVDGRRDTWRTAQQRDQPGRNHTRGAPCPHGRRRASAVVRPGDRRRNEPLQGTRKAVTGRIRLASTGPPD